MITFDEAVEIVTRNLGYDAEQARNALVNAIESGEIVPPDIIYETRPNEFFVMLGGNGKDSSKLPAADITRFIERRKNLLSGNTLGMHPPTGQGAVEELASVSKQRQQDDAILKWLRDNQYDPLLLPDEKKGVAGVRNTCWKGLEKYKKMFSSRSVFNTAWDRLRANKATQISKAK